MKYALLFLVCNSNGDCFWRAGALFPSRERCESVMRGAWTNEGFIVGKDFLLARCGEWKDK